MNDHREKRSAVHDSPLGRLPDEIALHALSYLDTVGLCVVARTCRWLCELSRCDSLWRERCVHRMGNNEEEREQLAHAMARKPDPFLDGAASWFEFYLQTLHWCAEPPFFREALRTLPGTEMLTNSTGVRFRGGTDRWATAVFGPPLRADTEQIYRFRLEFTHLAGQYGIAVGICGEDAQPFLLDDAHLGAAGAFGYHGQISFYDGGESRQTRSGGFYLFTLNHLAGLSACTEPGCSCEGGGRSLVVDMDVDFSTWHLAFHTPFPDRFRSCPFPRSCVDPKLGWQGALSVSSSQDVVVRLRALPQPGCKLCPPAV